jgi:hypothetical protein
MGHTEVADLLQENLEEEKAADEKLTELAEGGINQTAADAAHPENEDEDGDEDEAVGVAASSAKKRAPVKKRKAARR